MKALAGLALMGLALAGFPRRSIAQPSPTPTPRCVGACNGNGTVTVADIVSMVNVAEGKAGVATCRAGDANGDGEITIDEILAAVNNALGGCRDRPTHSPTSTGRPTSTSTASAARTMTPINTATATATATPTLRPTSTPTITRTPATSPTVTPSATAVPTRSNTPTATPTPKPFLTFTPTPQSSPTNTPPARDLSGHWGSVCLGASNVFTLTQSGASVTGTDSLHGGMLMGTLSGDQLTTHYECCDPKYTSDCVLTVAAGGKAMQGECTDTVHTGQFVCQLNWLF